MAGPTAGDTAKDGADRGKEPEEVPGTAGRLERLVEHKPDGRRLTRYRTRQPDASNER